MSTEERERKRRITDPVLVDLTDIFEDGHSPDAIAILTFTHEGSGDHSQMSSLNPVW